MSYSILRTFFITVILASLVVFFNGCFKRESAVTLKPDDYQYVVYEGRLQAVGSVNFTERATHLFRLNDGTVLYAFSDYYDLDDPRYLNQSVSVNGLLMPPLEEESKPLLSIEGIEPASAKAIETTRIEMETYTNPEMAFAMRYRNDWTIEENASFVLFRAPTPVPSIPKDATLRGPQGDTTLPLNNIAQPSGDTVVASLPATSPEPAVPLEPDWIRVGALSNLQELPIEEWYRQYGESEGTLRSYVQSAVGPERLAAVQVKEGANATFYIASGTIVFVLHHEALLTDFRLEYANLFSEMVYSFDPLADGQRPVADTSTNSTNSSASDFDSDISSDEPVKPAPLPETLIPDEDDDSYDQEEAELPKGYAVMESSRFGFQLNYPASWYYSGSGSNYYFSTEEAEVENALITLTVLNATVSEYTESPGTDTFSIDFPLSDGSSYRLEGASRYAQVMRTMAESLQKIAE